MNTLFNNTFYCNLQLVAIKTGDNFPLNSKNVWACMYVTNSFRRNTHKHYSVLKVNEEINKVYHGWISSFRREIFSPSLKSSSVMSSPIGLLKQEIKTIVIQGPNYFRMKLILERSLPSTHRSLLLQFHGHQVLWI